MNPVLKPRHLRRELIALRDASPQRLDILVWDPHFWKKPLEWSLASTLASTLSVLTLAQAIARTWQPARMVLAVESRTATSAKKPNNGRTRDAVAIR
jgi:hypothetical protein